MTRHAFCFISAASLWLAGASLATAQTGRGAESDAASGEKPQATLRAAYKREFAFLQAEKTTLAQRIKELETEAASKRQAAQAEVNRLQGAIMAAAQEAERLNQQMFDAERAVEGITDSQDALDRTLEQANALLERHEIELPERSAVASQASAAAGAGQPADKSSDNGARAEAAPAVPPAQEDVDLGQLSFALHKGVELLDQGTTTRTETARYFDLEGKEVEGPVRHIGRIASYGLVEGARGALAPAGGKRLKIWPEAGGVATAAAIANGAPPDHLGFFLYESLDQGIERRAEKTPLDIVRSGGVIAWVIVALGGLALLMIVLRALMLMRSAVNTEKLVTEIEPLLERGERNEAIEVCQRSHSAAGRVLRATLVHLDAEREHLEDIASEAILHETPTLDRFGSSILVLAAVAPLLGLLGTVTGMISTFDVITEFGTGNPQLLSGGISEALVTTELGLIVAIPSLLLGNMLGGWAERIKDDMDKAALRVANVAHGVRVSRHLSTVPAPAPSRASEPARA